MCEVSGNKLRHLNLEAICAHMGARVLSETGHATGMPKQNCRTSGADAKEQQQKNEPAATAPLKDGVRRRA